MEDKPAPNYFSGNWQRATGTVPHQPSPSGSGEQASLREHFTLSPDSDVTEAAMRVSMEKAPATHDENYTSDGTYIPLSGGMRGWFENSGVLNSEAPNHYGYRDAVHGDAFKQVILDRIETFNKRSAVRMRVNLWAAYVTEGNERLITAFCADLSVMGARIRTRSELNDGDRIMLTLYRSRKDIGEIPPLATMPTIVMTARLANPNQDSPRYYAGLEFHDVEIADKETLALLTAEGTPMPDREPRLNSAAD